jgi:hypothetical protein
LTDSMPSEIGSGNAMPRSRPDDLPTAESVAHLIRNQVERHDRAVRAGRSTAPIWDTWERDICDIIRDYGDVRVWQALHPETSQ